MLHITETVAIDSNEIQEEFVRSSGPGGQNVNKVATAVQLRFDVAGSPSLTEDVRERLIRLAGKRMTREGVLVIQAQRFRTQEQNRRDAMERFVELVRAAATKPRNRHKTKPTLGSKERRLESKRRRSLIKAQRRPSPP